MFGLLTNSSQIYGLQQAHEHTNTSNISNSSTKNSNNSNNNQHNNKQHRRSTSSLSDTVTGTGKEGSKFFATLSSMQGSIKSPTNFIEKFLKTELLNGYDSIKNYKSFQHTNSATTGATSATSSTSSKQNNHLHSHPEGILTSFNCLQGSYRSSCDSEFYEAVNVNSQRYSSETSDMTIKCSKNLLESHLEHYQQAPATLQNYQKLPECEHDMLPAASSGASSGEFNTSSSETTATHHHTPVNSLYKKLSFGGVGRIAGGSGSAKNLDATTLVQSNEIASDNSSSSISTTTTNSSSTTSTTQHTTTSLSNKSPNDLQRTSSASSSGDCTSARERKKSLGIIMPTKAAATAMDTNSTSTSANTKTPSSIITQLTPERAQRRKLMQMISNYDQQNKQLQRELAKEKRRRTEELACVVKSLICFESKLKVDMKSINQRLAEKDEEICRLVRQNRALKKNLAKLQADERDNVRDEGVVEDEGDGEGAVERDGRSDCGVGGGGYSSDDKETPLLLEDCLVLEALQCINCRKQFYDIDNKEGWTQIKHSKDGCRKKDDHTTEHGSSSDDTVSSSFYGARRSVRYTSKRTAGTFRDYMRSRSMNIDDAALDQNSEENTSTISRDDSQTSYEKINIYSRAIERMHGVKCESERDLELSGIEATATTERSGSRLSNKSNNSVTSGRSSNSSCGNKTAAPQNIEEDDGIFSPTQDDDFDEADDSAETGRGIKIVLRRSAEFSEASPKQVYETSTDDWYASASDQEEIGTTAASKSYGHGAVNPVLECVNQILLQQSMEESVHHNSNSNSMESSSGSENNQRLTPKSTPNYLQVNQPTTNLPRRSSLSGRRHSRSNTHSTDANDGGGGANGQMSATRSGTLARKRVHFSTKNSMVHVPRNDDHDENDDEENERGVNAHSKMISNLQQYHQMNYYKQQTATAPNMQSVAVTPTNVGGLTEVAEHERLDTLNYESIYSNEYEPIGSEHNSSNLYVDMESTVKMAEHSGGGSAVVETKMPKLPPALPPKPANLLKFKKSLQQLDEMPDEHLHQDCTESSNDGGTIASEPDYCSISEVNVRITSVQIVADVHKPPESEAGDLESQAAVSELDLEVSTLASDDTFAASQKTDEIEEIFADIPKLPNVAAIIAPKNPKYQQQQQQSDYLIMSPKVETPKLQNSRNLALDISASNASDYLSIPHKSAKLKSDGTPLKLQLNIGTPGQQYKRKHVPNILAEINKRMSQPNSPTTPTKLTTIPTPTKSKQSLLHSANAALLKNLENSSPNLPLQAEFDWYNLDAEYGSGGGLQLQQPDLLKVNENNSNMLAEIQEDHESIVAAADEYNLDEEFSLACEKQPDVLEECEERSDGSVEAEQLLPLLTEAVNSNTLIKLQANAALNAAICEAVNFPLFSENSPLVATQALPNTKAKKMKNNLANFEKFIEGSGLSTKPLPSKRKIYFAGPFV